MVFGEGALPLEWKWSPECSGFGEGLEILPSLGPVHPLARVDHRRLGSRQQSRRLDHIRGVSGSFGP